MRSPLRFLPSLFSLLLAASVGCAAPTGGGPAACPSGELCDEGPANPDPSGLVPSSPEICNGVDDDQNGRVDDIDVGGDGICDCLRIGLLGRPGKWGGGSAFSEWLLERGSYVEELGAAELNAETLSAFDVLLVNDVTDDDNPDHGIDRAYADAEVAALSEWVRAGGGLLTMIGYWSAHRVTNVNRLLAPFAMEYEPGSVLQRSGTFPVEDWDQTHPIAQNIGAIGAQNGNQPIGAGTIFAWDEASGVTAGLAQTHTAAVGEGRVVVWADEWITYDALWNDRPDYDIEQLWVNFANWLTPVDSCEIEYVIIIG